MLQGTAHAIDIKFAWNYDNAAAPNLAGFKLYQREGVNPYDYSNPVATIADPAARTATLPNVQSGKELYWVLRAYDKLGFESGNSNEVNADTGGPPAPTNFRIVQVDY